MKNNLDTAVVLAGGKGSRMGGETQHQQKCLTEINSKPILFYVIKNLIETGCKKIVVITNHYKEQVEYFIANEPLFSNASVIHTVCKGTAGALSAAKFAVNSDWFYYVHGDMFYPLELLANLKTVWQKKKSGVIAVSKLHLASTHPYISASKNNKIGTIYFPGRGENVPPEAYCSMEVIIAHKDLFNTLERIDQSLMVADGINQVKDKFSIFVHEKSWFHLENSTDLILQKDGLKLFDM